MSSTIAANSFCRTLIGRRDSRIVFFIYIFYGLQGTEHLISYHGSLTLPIQVVDNGLPQVTVFNFIIKNANNTLRNETRT
jgi:hypothetical protein